MDTITVDTLIHARWIVPVEPAGVVYENHSLAVRDRRIVALLPSEDARSRYRAAAEFELSQHLLTPGLINAHTHAAMTLMRGVADDLPLMEWLETYIWPIESQVVAADYVRDGTRLALLEQLRCGVTCINDMYFFPDMVCDCVREAGMRAAVGLIVIEFPSAWAGDADGYLDKARALLRRPEFADEPRLSFTLAPHAPYTVSDQTFVKVAALAEQHRLKIHMHVHETAAEVERALAEHGERPLARLDRLGLLTPRLAAVHMTQLEPAEIRRAAETGLSVLHCPESNLKLASGFCPVAALSEAGVNVALGTDGAASNNDLDLLGEMRTAAMLAKAVAGSAAALPAAAALQMATLNGARALGLDHEIGSLRPGKQADLAAFDLQRPETQPLYDPVSALVYAGGREQVSHVWVAGRLLLDERRPTELDEEAITAAATGWGERVRTLRANAGDGI